MICSGHVPSYRLNHLQFLRVYSTIQFKTPRRRGWHAGGRGRMNRHRVLEKKVCCVPRIRIHLLASMRPRGAYKLASQSDTWPNLGSYCASLLLHCARLPLSHIIFPSTCFLYIPYFNGSANHCSTTSRHLCN